jgi:hypothetical protein
LAQLKGCTEELESFRALAKERESYVPAESGGHSSKRDQDALRQTARRLQRLQEQAGKLHSVLAQGFQCRLHDSHLTHLLLERRVAEPGSGRRRQGGMRAGADDGGDWARFMLSFVEPGSPHKWRRAEVRVPSEVDETPER